MKIAFVYDTSFPWVTGGAERRIYEIAKRLAIRGHDVHIYSLGYWMQTEEYKSQKVIIKDNITYHSVGKPVDLYTKDNKRSIKEAIYFSTCILKCDLKDYDIVDCQGFPYFSCYSSKLKSKNLVITLHEVWNDYWYEYMGRIGFFGKIIEKGILHLTNNVICVSQLTYEQMLENRCPSNATVIANGVDTDKITYVTPRKEYSDIIFAGRLIPEKNVELIIRAIHLVKNKHPHLTCRIIGEGPEEEELKTLTQTLNLEENIIFEGFFDKQEDLYRSIKSSTMFILPSKREGFGIVTIEANACGVPVITLNHPMNASKDLITSDNGYLVGDDPEELAKIIDKILTTGITADKRNKCRRTAEKYDWNHITSLTEEYYTICIKEK